MARTLVQWVQAQRGHEAKKGGCASVPHPGLPSTKREAATAVAQCRPGNSDLRRIPSAHQHDIISEKTKKSLGNKLITLDTLLSGGNIVSSLLGQRYVLEMGLPSLTP